MAAAVAGFVSGAISTGTAKGAFQGMASAMLFYGAGQLATGLGGGEKAMVGTIWGNDGIGRALIHAAAGCVNARMSGGDCEKGAITAGASKLLSSNLPGAGNQDAGVAVLRAAIIGGTVSVLGGGKFANGARTSAFQEMFNALATKVEGNRVKVSGTVSCTGVSDSMCDKAIERIRALAVTFKDGSGVDVDVRKHGTLGDLLSFSSADLNLNGLSPDGATLRGLGGQCIPGGQSCDIRRNLFDTPVVTHEVAHHIGIWPNGQHNPDVNSVMFSSVRPDGTNPSGATRLTIEDIKPLLKTNN